MERSEVLAAYSISYEINGKGTDHENLETILFQPTLIEVPGGYKYMPLSTLQERLLQQFQDTKLAILQAHEEGWVEKTTSVIPVYSAAVSLSNFVRMRETSPSRYDSLIVRLKTEEEPRFQVQELKSMEIKTATNFNIDQALYIAVDSALGLKFGVAEIEKVDLRPITGKEYTHHAALHVRGAGIRVEVAPDSFKAYQGTDIKGGSSLSHESVIACHVERDNVDRAVARYLRNKFTEYAAFSRKIVETAPIEALSEILDAAQAPNPS